LEWVHARVETEDNYDDAEHCYLLVNFHSLAYLKLYWHAQVFFEMAKAYFRKGLVEEYRASQLWSGCCNLRHSNMWRDNDHGNIFEEKCFEGFMQYPDFLLKGISLDERRNSFSDGWQGLSCALVNCLAVMAWIDMPSFRHLVTPYL
jgi:hypothetical protein